MATVTEVRYREQPIESLTLELTGEEAQRLVDLISHVRLGTADVGKSFYNILDALESNGVEYRNTELVVSDNGLEIVVEGEE